VQWIYERAAGLRADREIPGSRRMIIAPQTDWRLHRIDASYDSPAGKWESGWEILDPKHIRVHAAVPFGCSASLTLPAADEAILKECAGKYGLRTEDGKAELEAGSYDFCYETSEPLRTVLNADSPITEVFGRPEARAFLEKRGIGINYFPDQARHLSVREISKFWAKVDDALVKLFDEELSRL
jgi:alpha-L-rhamnosidase